MADVAASRPCVHGPRDWSSGTERLHQGPGPAAAGAATRSPADAGAVLKDFPEASIHHELILLLRQPRPPGADGRTVRGDVQGRAVGGVVNTAEAGRVGLHAGSWETLAQDAVGEKRCQRSRSSADRRWGACPGWAAKSSGSSSISMASRMPSDITAREAVERGLTPMLSKSPEASRCSRAGARGEGARRPGLCARRRGTRAARPRPAAAGLGRSEPVGHCGAPRRAAAARVFAMSASRVPRAVGGIRTFRSAAGRAGAALSDPILADAETTRAAAPA